MEHNVEPLWGELGTGSNDKYDNDILDWQAKAIQETERQIWQAVPHAIIWATWRCRNKNAFENLEFDLQKLKMTMISLLWVWANY